MISLPVKTQTSSANQTEWKDTAIFGKPTLPCRKIEEEMVGQLGQAKWMATSKLMLLNFDRLCDLKVCVIQQSIAYMSKTAA